MAHGSGIDLGCPSKRHMEYVQADSSTWEPLMSLFLKLVVACYIHKMGSIVY